MRRDEQFVGRQIGIKYFLTWTGQVGDRDWNTLRRRRAVELYRKIHLSSGLLCRWSQTLQIAKHSMALVERKTNSFIRISLIFFSFVHCRWISAVASDRMCAHTDLNTTKKKWKYETCNNNGLSAISCNWKIYFAPFNKSFENWQALCLLKVIATQNLFSSLKLSASIVKFSCRFVLELTRVIDHCFLWFRFFFIPISKQKNQNCNQKPIETVKSFHIVVATRDDQNRSHNENITLEAMHDHFNDFWPNDRYCDTE